MSGKIFLTSRSSEVLAKPQGNGKIRITASWSTDLTNLIANPYGVDVDLGVMWESIDGRRKHAIQALGDHWGSHLRLPHLKLHGDDRSGNKGEVIDGTARGLGRFSVYVYNCSNDQPLSRIKGLHVTVQIPGCDLVVVEFNNVNGPACAVLDVKRRDDGFFISRTMKTIRTGGGRTNQEKIDRIWGYGLPWSPATKAPHGK